MLYRAGARPWKNMSKAAASAAKTAPPPVRNKGVIHSLRNGCIPQIDGLTPEHVNIVAVVDRASIKR